MKESEQIKEKEMTNQVNYQEQEWEVQEIINERKINKEGDKNFKKLEYLVKWVGYELPTWEPIENLENCRELLEEYLKKKRKNAIKNRKILINDIRTGEILNQELNRNNDNNAAPANFIDNNKKNNDAKNEQENKKEDNKKQEIPNNKNKSKKNERKEKNKNKSNERKNKSGKRRKSLIKNISKDNNQEENIIDTNKNQNDIIEDINTNNNINNINNNSENNSNPSNNSFMKASTVYTNSIESEKNNSNILNNFNNSNYPISCLDFSEVYKDNDQNDYNFDSLSNIISYDSMSCLSSDEIRTDNFRKNLIEKNNINFEIKGNQNINNDNKENELLSKKRFLSRNDLLNDERFDNWIKILSINDVTIPVKRKDEFILNITYQYNNSDSTFTDCFKSTNKLIPPQYLARYYEHVLSNKHGGEQIYKKVIFAKKIN